MFPKLIGKDYQGFIVIDNYGVYRKLDKHQLCRAHLHRKFRDLAVSLELSDKQRSHCQEKYRKFSQIYQDIKNNCFMDKYDEFTERINSLTIIN